MSSNFKSDGRVDCHRLKSSRITDKPASDVSFMPFAKYNDDRVLPNNKLRLYKASKPEIGCLSKSYPFIIGRKPLRAADLQKSAHDNDDTSPLTQDHCASPYPCFGCTIHCPVHVQIFRLFPISKCLSRPGEDTYHSNSCSLTHSGRCER